MDEFDVDAVLQAALDRLTLLSDAGAALSSTLDAREALRRVGRVVAGRLGDWCALDMCTEHGAFERVAVTGHGMGGPETFHEVFEVIDRAGPLGRVLRGAGPVPLNGAQITDAAAVDPALALFTRMGAGHVLILPLRVRREVLGALTVARRASEPEFDPEDTALATELAGRIALAVDNARLHGASARIAERLQRSLLPALPRTAGLDLAAGYSPAQDTAEVGGDWYDAFVLPCGDTALIIGDVAGHDLRAAVEMSQVRNMLRGIACDRQEPAGLIVRRLDVAGQTLYPAFTATCIYALVQGPAGGPWTLDYASAGHPPPLLVTAEGDTRYLTGGHGPMLGVQPPGDRSGAAEPLPRSSTLLLYTDGLIERRGEDIDTGFTRLRQHAAALADRPIEEFCDELAASLGPSSSDDIALLALRLPAATVSP